VTAEVLAELSPEKYPTEFFDPTVPQVGGAIALVGVGFALTALVARIGGSKA
jgi:hypothetical protein